MDSRRTQILTLDIPDRSPVILLNAQPALRSFSSSATIPGWFLTFIISEQSCKNWLFPSLAFKLQISTGDSHQIAMTESSKSIALSSCKNLRHYVWKQWDQAKPNFPRFRPRINSVVCWLHIKTWMRIISNFSQMIAREQTLNILPTIKLHKKGKRK